VLDVCHSDEIVRKQMSTMYSSTNNCYIEEIQKIKKYGHNTKMENQIGGKYISNKDVKIINYCKRCGRSHKIDNCLAYLCEKV
jgi:hypothetical protein